MITDNSIASNLFSSSKIYKAITKKIKKDIYSNSEFLPLKNLSSRSKGAEMENYCKEFLLEQGRTNTSRTNSQHDWITDLKKIEHKGSFLWDDKQPFFRWQQIRSTDDYDYIIFSAYYPDKVKFFYADKETIKLNVEIQDSNGNWIYNQHGGKLKNSGTFCIDGLPEDFSWMKPLTKDVIL